MKFPPLTDSLTAAERALGRLILKDPPNLRDWIRKFGGYHRITAEGWAEYDAVRSAPCPAANETPSTDLLRAVQGQRKGQGLGEAKRRRTAR